MLTKDSKKVLDFMNSHQPDLQDAFYTVDFIAMNMGYQYMRALAICETLENEKYIIFADKQRTVVRPLEKGINYRDLKTQEILQFLNRSVLIPFAVSAATSLITIFFTNLFS